MLLHRTFKYRCTRNVEHVLNWSTFLQKCFISGPESRAHIYHSYFDLLVPMCLYLRISMKLIPFDDWTRKRCRNCGPLTRWCVYTRVTRRNEEENVARGFAMGNKSVSRRAIHVEMRVKFPVTWKRTFVSGKRNI